MGHGLVVISGGLGSPSTSSMLGRQLGESPARDLALRGTDADLTVLELRDYAGEITSNLSLATLRRGLPKPLTRYRMLRA